MQEIRIKIVKWEKYQHRKDTKNPWWFSVHNELWRNPEFSIFTAEEKVVWYAVLAIAGKRKNAEIIIDLTYLAQNAGVDKNSVLTAIEKCKNNNWIEGTCTESVRNLYETRTLHNITRHNITLQNIITKDTDLENQVSIKKPFKNKKSVGKERVIAVYSSAYKSRYQVRPEIDGKTIGLINSLLKTHSVEKLSNLIDAYLKMDDPWFIKKAHDFSTFRENLTKVSTAMQTGNNLSNEPKRPKIYHEELWKPVENLDDR